MTSLTRSLFVLVAAGLMAVIFAQPAVAQTANKLKCNGCVKSKQIRNGGIKGKDIRDGTVGSADLGNDAKAAGADSSEVSTLGVPNPLTLGDTVVTGVAITAPAPGLAIVTATTTCVPITAIDTCVCSISVNSSSLDATQVVRTEGTLAPPINGTSLAATRGFSIPAGTTQFNFVCTQGGLAAAGANGTGDASMTAIYVPQAY